MHVINSNKKILDQEHVRSKSMCVDASVEAENQLMPQEGMPTAWQALLSLASPQKTFKKKTGGVSDDRARGEGGWTAESVELEDGAAGANSVWELVPVTS